MSDQVYDTNLLLSNLSTILDSRINTNKENDDLRKEVQECKLRKGVHLAIFVEPFLQYIIDGKKTVESRFSVNRIAPFNKIFRGDIIFLKKSGGPIVGFCFVEDVWFYQLKPSTWKDIRKNFEAALCAQDPLFWESRKHASYATLIKLGEFQTLPPIKFKKKDRRGWVVLKSKSKYKNLMELL